MTVSGVARMMQRHGELAGVPDLHPHRFRHSFAHQWLSEGGGEGDLLAGWRSQDMLARYGARAADERALGRAPATEPRGSAVTRAVAAWSGDQRALDRCSVRGC